MVAYEIFLLSQSQFCYATCLFLVEIHFFKLSLKSKKDSLDHLFPEVISLSLKKDYKKGFKNFPSILYFSLNF